MIKKINNFFVRIGLLPNAKNDIHSIDFIAGHLVCRHCEKEIASYQCNCITIDEGKFEIIKNL